MINEQFEKDLKMREQELSSTLQKRNQIEDMYHSKDLSYEAQRNEWLTERMSFQKKIDEIKKKNDEMHDSFLQKKMLLEKNVALSQQ